MLKYASAKDDLYWNNLNFCSFYAAKHFDINFS